ncbi:MAG: DUF3710 domain-containing protein [Propionibacteriales bacterium]|nr:DUF3710 domain-containing protein [Propionibacteriales bacterium]
MLRRRKNKAEEEGIQADESAAPEALRIRAAGPWDFAEKSVEDDPTYLDLGSLVIHGRTGINISMPTDGDSDTTGAVVMLTDDAGLEMRAFASTRSGGLWDEVRAELLDDIERRQGESVVIEGLFGTELQVKLPVTLADGEAGVQPSRIIGVEGPRWFLRATFLGKAALEPSDEGLLMDCFRDTIVKRGSGPMVPGDPLVLTVPRGPVVADEDD